MLGHPRVGQERWPQCCQRAPRWPVPDWPFDKSKANLGAASMTFALYRLLYLNAPLNRERQSKDLISLPYLVRFGKASSLQNCCPGSTSHLPTSTLAARQGVQCLKSPLLPQPPRLSAPLGMGCICSTGNKELPKPKKQAVMSAIIPAGFCRPRRHLAFLLCNMPKAASIIIAQT